MRSRSDGGERMESRGYKGIENRRKGDTERREKKERKVKRNGPSVEKIDIFDQISAMQSCNYAIIQKIHRDASLAL